MFLNFNETILHQESMELCDAVHITERWMSFALDCKINQLAYSYTNVPVIILV